MPPVTLFHSSGRPGYAPAVRAMPGALAARKLERDVGVRFAAGECLVATAEGTVRARAGDAIVSGFAGEEWPVPRGSFEQSYAPLGTTAMGTNGWYRRLPKEVIAVRIFEPFAVILADGKSRLDGGVGDWLVDYGDGTLGVIADAIFITTYETI